MTSDDPRLTSLVELALLRVENVQLRKEVERLRKELEYEKAEMSRLEGRLTIPTFAKDFAAAWLRGPLQGAPPCPFCQKTDIADAGDPPTRVPRRWLCLDCVRWFDKEEHG